MPTKFQIKRSTISGVVPTTGDISSGELAVNLADKKLFTANATATFELGSNLINLSVTGNTTIVGLIANGSLGSAGQVLHSNGTGIYWNTSTGSGTVTSIATGNGLTGGPITDTGTVSVLANNGISANSTGTFVIQGTGTVVNTTGVHVDSAYIATIASNSATYANSSITNNFTVGTASYFVTNGNFGVGNSTPTHKLRVEGSFSVTGNSTFDTWVDLKNYVEVDSSPTIITNTLTLDLSNSMVFDVALNAAINTLNITNTPSTASRAVSFVLIFTADGTPRAVVWPNSVRWPGNTAPTLTSTNNKRDIFTFLTTDAGTSWNSFISGQNI